MRRNTLLAGFLLFYSGGLISPSERTDDWWLAPHVDVSVEFRPMYLPSQSIRDAHCTPRKHFVAPWVTEFPAEISAYNSEVGQTDADPWIASNGKRVFDGGIASNSLPCGTRIMIPDLFGERIFVVNDRMHRRYQPIYQEHGLVNVDVWMSEKADAKRIGRKTGLNVVIVEYAGA